MLLGRERELHAIGGVLAQARAGSSSVLAVVGEPGIGKSALLEWAAASAHGMNVLRARGVQSEAHVPFAGLLELLRPALDGLRDIPEPQAAALESALALRPAVAHDRFAVGAATLSLLAAHAEAAPTAVLVDDAQRLDASSSDALRFALRRLVADPIAIVLTVRAGEPSLLDGTDVPTMRLAGLGLEAAVELARREAPQLTPEAAERLHRDTGGNPLAVIELAKEPPVEVPLETPVPLTASVAGAYLERARALPERTRSALVVSAASDTGDVALLARAAASLGLGVSDLVPAEARGLIAIRSGRLEFRHPLTRSAIYGDASAEERRRVHRALAEALPETEVDRRAWHLALGAVGPDADASSALEQAAVRARGRSAYATAADAFERAASLSAEEGRRASLVFAAADAAWLAGLDERAALLLEDAARSAGDSALSIEVEHLRGHIALRRGPIGRGREILLGAAERAAADRPEAAVVMLAEAAEGAFFAGDAAGMRACAERARELMGAADGHAAYFGLMIAGMGRILSGEGEQGADLVRKAVGLLERSEDPTSDVHLLAWAAMGPLWLRETNVGESLVDRALEAARARPAAGALPHLLTHIGIEQAATDRCIEAQATFDEAIRLARETGQRTVLAGALGRLAWVEARCGREHAASANGEEALALANELGAHLFEIWALGALGELGLVRGDAQAALDRFSKQQQALDEHAIADPDLSPATERTELYLRVRSRREAKGAAEPFLVAAAAKGQPWALARAARCRALLAGDDDFADHFEEALELHARTPDAFETARTELAYGGRLRRTGQRVRAREHLRAALTSFDGLGASPWAEQARVELKGTGETARRRDPSTLDELTAQELKVSLLLAHGKTTREAAAELFLSPKTIEYHLRNVYRKLGVNSREQLSALLPAGGAIEAGAPAQMAG